MLNLSKVRREIERKKAELDALSLDSKLTFEIYFNKLSELTSKDKSSEEFNRLVESSEEKFIGAKFSKEFDEFGLSKTFRRFNNKQDVLSWKENILSDRLTVATDGSQIYQDKNLSLFFGAVQVAWFMNYHDETGKHIKDVDFELVLPDRENTNKNEGIGEFNQHIDFLRFSAEINKLCELMENLKDLKFTKTPVFFFDGSMTISFEKNNQRKKQYIACIERLIEVSERCEIPVVAYIDVSLASNLVNSLKYAFNLDTDDFGARLSDAALVKGFLKDGWGNRTPLMHYLEKEGQNEILNEIDFLYLNNSSRKQKPCRIELPSWIGRREGMLDEVIDVIMAESLVGNGYLYPIESADAAAVIQAKEKEIFYEYLQKFLKNNSEDILALSAKLDSKKKRRRMNVKI